MMNQRLAVRPVNLRQHRCSKASRHALCVCTVILVSFVFIYSMIVGHIPTDLFHTGLKGFTRIFSPIQVQVPYYDNSTAELAFSTNRTRIIMFWSKWYGSDIWFNMHEKDLGTSLFQNKYCTYKDCELTNDHSRLREADLVLFYYTDSPNWPLIRYAHQFYAHFVFEAPGSNTRKFLSGYEGKINVTINYRHDADLYIPYAKLLPVSSKSTYKPMIPLANKTKMAVWPVSHCGTPSHREKYVQELSKYMKIDKYGKCGGFKCPRSQTHQCLENWARDYKFYLSLENNICKDYITEKLFQPLEYEIIPVVLGGGDYTKDAPPHSVINARDFSSIKALAEFLIELAADEKRYQSYFAWKTQYKKIIMQEWLMCRLCQSLHEQKFQTGPARTNYTDYWFGRRGETCDNGLVSRLIAGYNKTAKS